jgi:hypothetical protein
MISWNWNLFDVAYQIVDYKIAENLFEQSAFSYHYAGLFLDLFLLAALPLLLSLPALSFSVLVVRKTKAYLITHSQSAHEQVNLERLVISVCYWIAYYSFYFWFWFTILVIVLAEANFVSGHGYFLFSSRLLSIFLSVIILTITMVFVCRVFFSIQGSSALSLPVMNTTQPLSAASGEDDEEEETQSGGNDSNNEPNNTAVHLDGIKRSRHRNIGTKQSHVIEVERSGSHGDVKSHFRTPSKQYQPKPILICCFILALIITLLSEGICNQYSPIGWSTTASRWIVGDFCTTSPCFVYLLLPEQHTSTSMTIVFHSPIPIIHPQIHYSIRDTRDQTQIVQSQEIHLVNDYHVRYIYVTTLTQLQPQTEYSFIAGTVGKWSQVYHFRTLPLSFLQSNETVQLRIVVGGDLGLSQNTENLIQRANSVQPHFIILGGDLAYEV